MEDWYQSAVQNFESYVEGFSELTPDKQKNFDIKKDHSLRVAANAKYLATALNLEQDDEQVVVIAAVFHDIGRFRQMAEFNTLDDGTSLNHAELSVEILKERDFLKELIEEQQNLVYNSIVHHNKTELPRNISGRELLHARLLRDADKLDILKVLTRYYNDKNQPANHMLTWELPPSSKVSPGVLKEIMAGKIVTRKEVKNEADVKIMQLSWVYDINFKSTMELILRNRYLDSIYNSLPKNDQVFEIYRKVKVFAENKMLE